MGFFTSVNIKILFLNFYTSFKYLSVYFNNCIKCLFSNFQEQDNVEIDPYSHNNSRLSDIVKGTVKPTTRDTKTQTESATKDSSTITVKEAVPSDGAFTPPISPDL